MSDNEPTLPIVSLIEARSRELGLSPIELIRRAGYKNTTKGLRRLDSLLDGHLGDNVGLIRGLPESLGLSLEVVLSAVEETHRLQKGAQEAAWRTAFEPHSIITTERTVPQPIFVAAIFGVANLLRIALDLDQTPDTFVNQALEGLRKKLASKNGSVPGFGQASAFVVNYAPERAVEYDLKGNPLRVLDRARRLGSATFEIGSRPFNDSQLAAIFPGARAQPLKNA